ncbi:hypothetical protein NC653_040612 [Populus alba x Populus x berolinensis]|uniref:Uncharacterized protein n=2 Tax=Populus TaxID=3689 RepID=A0A4U5PQ42_POPAL|nr:hypothetical protein NC653_040612 [Populus alba x Populus x berolinensis]TKR98983.1 hypothetical protein D5086_0000197640 [Populus alba]
MKTDSSQQELPGKLYGVWFRSYRLRANLKRFQHKKIQTEDINGVPVIQNETINEVPVVQPVAAHFITHDPAEEEVAWMKNSLELDPLHYLVSEAIEYSMAAFDLMKQEDESETETSTADTLMLKMLTR